MLGCRVSSSLVRCRDTRQVDGAARREIVDRHEVQAFTYAFAVPDPVLAQHVLRGIFCVHYLGIVTVALSIQDIFTSTRPRTLLPFPSPIYVITRLVFLSFK